MVDKERALKDIRNAWIAAYVSAGIIMVAVLLARFVGVPLHGADWGSLLEITVLMALAFGVYLKSRAASVTLLLFFIIIQMLLRVDGDIGVSGVFVILLLGWLYAKGVKGAFAYHRIDSASEDSVDLPDEELVAA